MPAVQTTAAPLRRPRLLLVSVLAAFVVAGLGPLAHPPVAQAGTAEAMENQILEWINQDRAKIGKPALRLRTSLRDFAGDRASYMASTNELKHPSCLGCKLNQRGISWTRCGEVIAWTTWPWGWQAAKSIFNGWKGSSGHWNLLMSSSYGRIGIGVAYRSQNRSSWAAAVLTN
jgi:uncharacterized protein YkwD